MIRALALMLLLPGAALAAPRHVLELFTSQSCSSCPPADALLAHLAATRPDLLALDFHVDYWDGLGWRDRFSSADATTRQRDYAARLGTETYTPELVIDGRHAVVGSDGAAIDAALDRGEAAAAPPALLLTGERAGVTIDVGAGRGRATVLLVGYDPRHQTAVRGGENAGRLLTEVNVVRGFRAVGTWTGAPLHLAAPLPAGARCAVLLQSADGPVLAAATAN